MLSPMVFILYLIDQILGPFLFVRPRFAHLRNPTKGLPSSFGKSRLISLSTRVGRGIHGSPTWHMTASSCASRQYEYSSVMNLRYRVWRIWLFLCWVIILPSRLRLMVVTNQKHSSGSFLMHSLHGVRWSPPMVSASWREYQSCVTHCTCVCGGK